MLSSDVAEPYLKNAITIGHPCVNYITKLFLNYTGSCENVSSEEYAVIKYVTIKNNYTALVAYGSTPNATRKLGYLLANYSYWQKTGLLRSSEIFLRKSELDSIVMPLIFSIFIAGEKENYTINSFS